MAAGERTRSTADAQRERIVRVAGPVFARTGYSATPVAEVSAAAGVSTAYVFRLFPGKLGLFVAALQHCYDRIHQTMLDGADAASGDSPQDVLSAMAEAYASLIADRDLLMLQVHAQSACDVPEIRAAVRTGLAQVVTAVKTRSGASDEEVQRFMAYGQLCHLVVTAELGALPDGWARTLTAGIRHPRGRGSGRAVARKR